MTVSAVYVRRLPRLPRLFCLPYVTRCYTTHQRPLTVLGIETSCDDTSAAIVTSDRRILAEVVHGQQDLHQPMGGIVPTLASLGHSRHMPDVICRALQQAGLGIQDMDAIAVTRGPGLPPCLPVGLNAAKSLAAVHQLPLIGVHHMEAHALTARLTTPIPPQFPFVTLLISGGHTLLLTVHGLGDYTVLGSTIDCAVGEAIDKTSRLLQLAWVPGRRGGPGAALEQAAHQGNADRFLSRLPTPLLQRRKSEVAFSFSGLRTAMADLVEQVQPQQYQDTCDLAAAFQMVCVRHIEQKLKVALDQQVVSSRLPLTALVVSGGVASNALFRSRLEAVASAYQLPLVCPPPQYCTDNGVMIAWTGIERLQAGLVDDYTITTLPRWPLESLKKRENPPYPPISKNIQ
ncbi:glycoprotease family-domain-containing protein [Spinellus fusiger]|nr:glycoprotease family-domain-containing protein [Spinellus fusiger]